DAEDIFRKENIPLFSLESYRPLGEFDIIGFTLSYEMVYTNLLNILDLAGIPLKAKDRTDEMPLVIAGGPVVNNPAPTSDFVDIFYLGDAEENIIKILEIVKDSKELSRTEKLKRIVSNVPAVYVPEFYDPKTFRPIIDEAPEFVKSARLKELKPAYYPQNNLIPYIETIHDRLSVEIMRGCPRACRFCQATAIYRPVRKRPKEEIIAQVYEQLGKTGYDEVSLLSLSSSDYPDIVPLMGQLSRELHKKQVALSLPSLRPGTFTQNLADAIKLCRKTGLTFAPEAGTERLRAVIRKDITDKQLY
ncbi:MAG: radical SAM protein, partial [candidate division Zixibacteria bacterium]|nr:radical SAM protein [candidate division Zixibacteria bacterium]